MQYYSTNHKVDQVSFSEAVIQGLPADNGLFMPVQIPLLDESFLHDLPQKSLAEIGFEVASKFVGDDIPPEVLMKIVSETLAFDMPVRKIEDSIYTLELFHGPTCAFKDVGARFLARCLGYFSKTNGKEITILVATSGDTGSAVAHGFLGIPGVKVVILYPSGKVSEIQEKQLTTLGQNVTALEVNGTFDDCQKLVKQAFLDVDFKKEFNLTSANSINIARLIPQSFYYFHAVSQLGTDRSLVFSVPSGNYGNLSAGLIAKRMGLPIAGFVASSNANDVIPEFLTSGEFNPRPSVQTISNAMDVGNPSNFYRIYDLYKESVEDMRKDITGYSFDDEATKVAMSEVYESKRYVLDPHGAVGYLGLKQYLASHEATGVFLGTAHPAKFLDVVESTLAKKVEIPERLADYMKKKKFSIQLEAEYAPMKALLKEHLTH